MALTKRINGIVVPLEPQEEAQLRAEWAANEAAAQARMNSDNQKRSNAQAYAATLEAATGLTIDQIRDALKYGGSSE